MREILFRGKRVDNGEWVEGTGINTQYDMHGRKHIYIGVWHFSEKEPLMKTIDWYEVIPETVGQYTGLTDKNGKKIFEGDIIKNDWCFACGYSVIKFGQYKPLDMSNEYQQGHLGFYLEHIHKADKRSVRKDILFFANKCEVIGNIHDNVEFLEVHNVTENRDSM